MILYKVIAFIILAGMVVCMSAVITTGIQNKNGTPSTLPHQFYARYLLALTIAFVLFIEIGVRIRGGIVAADALFWIHIACASAFLILIVLLNFFFSGEQSTHHAILAYATAALFGGMATTGAILLARL